MTSLPARVLALLIVLGGACASHEEPRTPSPQVSSARELVWSDEFDTNGLPDPAKWDYEIGGHGWGNDELQFYTAGRGENARVEDGHLIIEARRDFWNGHEYTSARLRSRAGWTYGRFEIRARVPCGRGTWPAIWMLPAGSSDEAGGWPETGEIDIMEHVGHDPGVIHASIHTGAYNWRAGTQKTATIDIPDACDAFHTYVLDWTASEMRAYVDDREYFRFANERLQKPSATAREWPFDRPFTFRLNVAVGGVWGGEHGVDPSIWPRRMAIDYVRVFSTARSGPPSGNRR